MKSKSYISLGSGVCVDLKEERERKKKVKGKAPRASSTRRDILDPERKKKIKKMHRVDSQVTRQRESLDERAV